MKKVFSKRRQDFQNQCLKYLQYVLNDHFVLFLLIFIGFLAIQYSQLLKNIPADKTPIILFFLLFSIAIIPMGSIATYLEKADILFLLPKETELYSFLRKQVQRSYILFSILQTILLLILAPLFLALNSSIEMFALYCLFLLVAKWFFFQFKSRRFFTNGQLNWQNLLVYEDRRKQGILRFFALFTNVKGISNSVKRRKYLDVATNLLAKKHSTTWQNLFLRSYLRNGDLFGLTVRLLGLSLLVIVLVEQTWVATAFVLLFNYLLIFQLIALHDALDYQYLTILFPIDKKEKIKGAKQIISIIGYIVLLIQLGVSVLFFQEKLAVLVLLGFSLLLHLFYLPFKLKRLVD
ncbi:MAG: ABC transporter permease [Streptococcus sp.]|nr:ABC transporter permease [Streptococcus sp.]